MPSNYIKYGFFFIVVIIGFFYFLDIVKSKGLNSKIKRLEKENDLLLRKNDSLEGDNFTLLLNVKFQEVEIDSINELNRKINKNNIKLKKELNDVYNQEYFNFADDSLILSIFDGTNIATKKD